MVTKLFLKPINSYCYSLPLTYPFSKPQSFPKSPILSLFSNTTNPSQSLTLTLTQSVSYGPSLLKGKTPSQVVHSDDKLVNEDQFTRIFDVAALRVPAKDCFALESRLRGHLLNWPRIQNIARVPGDEIDDSVIAALLKNNAKEENGGYGEEEEEEQKNLDSLQRRIHGKAEGDGERLSPVLYRERLAKSFNARGFVKFRNLARISRPKKRKERERKAGKGCGKEAGKKSVVVEVVEDTERAEMKGLLGKEFEGSGTKWRGSTRLLLLDERYANKGVEELPQAVQVGFPVALVVTFALILD